MAVRADDFALGHFSQDPLGSGSTDHPRNGLPFRVRVSMIEVHCTWRKAACAIRAWHVTETIEQPGLATPGFALSSKVRRIPWSDIAPRVPRLRSHTMAICAYDIALTRFVQYRRTRLSMAAPAVSRKLLSDGSR